MKRPERWLLLICERPHALNRSHGYERLWTHLERDYFKLLCKVVLL